MHNSSNGAGLNRSEIAQMIITSLQEVLAMDNNGSSNLQIFSPATRLLGREAVLDSMGLVNLIVEVEQRLEDIYDLTVVLADERAMSQKNSPFRSVETLADYICQLAEE